MEIKKTLFIGFLLLVNCAGVSANKSFHINDRFREFIDYYYSDEVDKLTDSSTNVLLVIVENDFITMDDIKYEIVYKKILQLSNKKENIISALKNEPSLKGKKLSSGNSLRQLRYEKFLLVYFYTQNSSFYSGKIEVYNNSSNKMEIVVKTEFPKRKKKYIFAVVTLITAVVIVKTFLSFSLPFS